MDKTFNEDLGLIMTNANKTIAEVRKGENYGMSRTIQKYIDIIKVHKDLSLEKEQELISRAKQGDIKSRDILFASFFKIVLGTARKYASHPETFEDLIQEGMRGLEHAFELFKPEKKYRFCTYARQWIRAYILKFFSDNVRGFRVPTEISIKLYHINQIIESLSKELLREPTNEEISLELDMDENYVAFLRKYLFPHFSLDMELTGHDSTKTTIGQNLPDNHRDNPGESLIRNDNIKCIREALNKLSYRERFIIDHRYSINGEGDGEGMTLAQIGKKLNLTPERIRQIQCGAEIKLKKLMEN